MLSYDVSQWLVFATVCWMLAYCLCFECVASNAAGEWKRDTNNDNNIDDGGNDDKSTPNTKAMPCAELKSTGMKSNQNQWREGIFLFGWSCLVFITIREASDVLEHTNTIQAMWMYCARTWWNEACMGDFDCFGLQSMGYVYVICCLHSDSEPQLKHELSSVCGIAIVPNDVRRTLRTY